MSRHEDPVFKPSIEFYVDRGMGLCVVTTTKDGRQRTAQYLREGEPVEWLADSQPEEPTT